MVQASIRCDTECCSFREAKEDGATKSFEVCTGERFELRMLTPWLESRRTFGVSSCESAATGLADFHLLSVHKRTKEKLNEVARKERKRIHESKDSFVTRRKTTRETDGALRKGLQTQTSAAKMSLLSVN